MGAMTDIMIIKLFLPAKGRPERIYTGNLPDKCNVAKDAFVFCLYKHVLIRFSC